MSHGRIVCECGEVLSSCRCPGPHVDTVGKTPCPHRNPKCKPSNDPKDREISLLRTALAAAQERERVMRELVRVCVEMAPEIPKGTQPHGQDMGTTIRMDRFRRFHARLANAIAALTPGE